MAKLTSDPSNTLKGRRPTDKLGGRAKKPFLYIGLRPAPISRNKNKSSGLKAGRKTTGGL